MQFEFTIMYVELVIKVSGVLFVENEYIYGKHFSKTFLPVPGTYKVRELGLFYA
jgi:hypothetical protein